MQRIIAAATILAAVGIVSAFAASQVVPRHRAGAAPSARQVREQNLDGSGFIRTHEQGTASVNVANLPTDQQGNVRVTGAAPTGQLISVAEQLTIAPHTISVTPYVDTAHCASLTVFVNGSGSGSVRVSLRLSADGTTTTTLSSGLTRNAGGGGGGGEATSLPSTTFFSNGLGSPLVTPNAAVEMDNITDFPVMVDNGWIFCSQ